MMTADTHVNRLYITHLLRICWYTSVHVEYLPYHLPLFELAISKSRDNTLLLHIGNKNRFLPIPSRWWAESVPQRYMFFLKRSRNMEINTGSYVLKWIWQKTTLLLVLDYGTFSQIKVVVVFTLTPSPIGSIPLFIGITGVRVKVRVEVTLTLPSRCKWLIH